MALCVEIDVNGVIHQSAQPIDACTHYVLLSATEHQSLPTLTDIFTIPVSADLQQMWMLGFTPPIIAYLITWGYGVVINWFNERNH